MRRGNLRDLWASICGGPVFWATIVAVALVEIPIVAWILIDFFTAE